MTRVRPFRQDDIPDVARLTWRFLYGQECSPPAALEYYLQQLFFLGPYTDPNLPSLVCPDHRGMVVGFLGVVTRRMSSTWGPLRVAFGSNFIVHPDRRTTPASLELAASFLSGGQDLSLSDTANETSQAIWLGFGGVRLPVSDRYWSRPLRPGLYALRAVSRFRQSPLASALIAASRPLCQLADSVASRVSFGPLHRCALKSVPLDEDTLLRFLSKSWAGHPIRPVCDRHSLHWLLDFMRHVKARGDFRTVALGDEAGNAVGCYLYYAKQGEIGEVVYLGAEDRYFDQVFDHLLHDAETRGVIALHGKPEPGIAHKLSERFCFFYAGRDPLLVHSRESDLTRLVQNGGIGLTRLDGEWCLKFGSDLTSGDRVRGTAKVRDTTPSALPLGAARSRVRVETVETPSETRRLA